MLENLASRMELGHPWEGPLDGAAAIDDNPSIPSGYTYLAQLAAHDLSPAELPLPELGKGLGEGIQGFKRAMAEPDDDK